MNNAIATEVIKFSSGQIQTSLVELFTSQGCSSCPPAEHWLNKFSNSNALWETVVPITFHVDYWDRLGWPDPYANSTFSARQYWHQQQGHVRSVYTPGMLVNGKEWRGWIRNKDFPAGVSDAGILSVTANPQLVEVNYSKPASNLILNVALLGIGMQTDVARGENKGRVLNQDFVVLSHDVYSASNDGWKVKLPKYASNLA